MGHVYERITLPGGLGEVQLEDAGEHHMGSNSIFIHLPFPVGGSRRYDTTNGDAYYSVKTGHLVIRDACVIVRYHLEKKTIDSLSWPGGWYLSTIEEGDDGYHIEVYDNDMKDVLHIPFDDPRFQPGLSHHVKNGRFPSAYP